MKLEKKPIQNRELRGRGMFTVLSHCLVKDSSRKHGKYITYVILITGSDGTQSSRKIYRRFNEFKCLYTSLKQHEKTWLIDIPMFSHNSLVTYTSRFDPLVLKYRKRVLQQFLWAIETNRNALFSKLVAEFIDDRSSSGEWTSTDRI